MKKYAQHVHKICTYMQCTQRYISFAFICSYMHLYARYVSMKCICRKCKKYEPPNLLMIQRDNSAASWALAIWIPPAAWPVQVPSGPRSGDLPPRYNHASRLPSTSALLYYDCLLPVTTANPLKLAQVLLALLSRAAAAWGSCAYWYILNVYCLLFVKVDYIGQQ